MNYVKTTVLMLLIAGLTVAQPVQAPQMGGPLDTLVQNIQNNTVAMQEATKKIEDQYGFLQDQNRKWASTLIMGNTVLLSIGYVSLAFVDSRRRKRLKKTHEEYIEELEGRLKAQEKFVIESLTHINEETSQLLVKNQILQDKYELTDRLLKEVQPQINVLNKTSYLAGIATCLGLIVIVKFMGVF